MHDTTPRDTPPEVAAYWAEALRESSERKPFASIVLDAQARFPHRDAVADGRAAMIRRAAALGAV